MKSVFCYLLTFSLATSSLVAGPKPIVKRKPGSPEMSDPNFLEQKTEILRRENDTSSDDGLAADSTGQQRDPNASAHIAALPHK